MGTTLLDSVKVTQVMAAVTAGTTVQNSAGVDMLGFQGVVFLAAFGALTANQVTSIQAQHADAMNATAVLTTPGNLTGTLVGPLADNASNKCLMVEVNRPTKRYVGCTVNRATANAVINGVWAIQYGADYKPTTQDSTSFPVASEIHISEPTGTA